MCIPLLFGMLLLGRSCICEVNAKSKARDLIDRLIESLHWVECLATPIL